LKYLRHSAQASERWTYDAIDRVVKAHFVNGDVSIPVCSQRHPRIGAFFIHRRDEDQWVISPAQCTDRGKGFTARNVPYDKDGVHCEFITLTGAPDGVNNMIGDLFEEMSDDTPTQRMCPKCNARGFTAEGECTLCNGKCALSPVDADAWEKLSGR
jgi:hypothetical protein